jgi:hypothetical protein
VRGGDSVWPAALDLVDGEERTTEEDRRVRTVR